MPNYWTLAMTSVADWVGTWIHPDGTLWDGTDWETYAGASIADYDGTVGSRLGSSMLYQFAIPSGANFGTGLRGLVCSVRAGADLTEAELGARGQVQWLNVDGSGNLVPLAALTATERNAIADALLDRTNGVETGVTPRQYMQRVGATAAGKSSGARTGTETFTGMDGSTDRVQATVDASGNRTPITYDP
jgi:hypothetical protein